MFHTNLCEFLYENQAQERQRMMKKSKEFHSRRVIDVNLIRQLKLMAEDSRTWGVPMQALALLGRCIFTCEPAPR